MHGVMGSACAGAIGRCAGLLKGSGCDMVVYVVMGRARERWGGGVWGDGKDTAKGAWGDGPRYGATSRDMGR